VGNRRKRLRSRLDGQRRDGVFPLQRIPRHPGNLRGRGVPFIEPGTFCNGFHETWQIVHAEEAYGFAKTGQTIVNVPDATILKLYVDDEPLYLPTARVTQYVRRLDFRSGVLVRELNWSTPSGKQVQLTSRRLISLENRHLGAISYEITTDTDAPIVVSSQMLNRQDSRAEDEPLTPGGSDPRRARAFSKRVLNARSHVEDDLRIAAGYRTTNSRMSLGVGIDHRIETENHWELQRSWSDDLGKVVFVIDGKADQPIRVTKFFSYHTSRSVPATELVDRSSRTLDRAVRMGYSELERQQQAFLDHFWERSDIVIDAEPRVQQAVRWNLFQLCQSSARAETTGIPAKGLSGQAYEGHYFWDTEIYVVPFLDLHPEPRIARNLLRFRHSMLDKARVRAQELSRGRRPLPVAHDQRRRSVVVLCRGNGAVPHQRRHRLRHQALRADPQGL
jgi:alpha,alpha-trehalose phosphorylase